MKPADPLSAPCRFYWFSDHCFISILADVPAFPIFQSPAEFYGQNIWRPGDM